MLLDIKAVSLKIVLYVWSCILDMAKERINDLDNTLRLSPRIWNKKNMKGVNRYAVKMHEVEYQKQNKRSSVREVIFQKVMWLRTFQNLNEPKFLNWRLSALMNDKEKQMQL